MYQELMVHTVKGLLKVYEGAEGLLIIVFMDPGQITQGEDVVYAGSAWPETILLLHQYIIAYQKANSGHHKSRIHLADEW